MREELHERLEGMVLDVQDLIDSQENPENSPANAESDELYVLYCLDIFYRKKAYKWTDFEQSSNRL